MASAEAENPSPQEGTASQVKTEQAQPIITVYVMPGSQYSAKVLAAFDALELKHYVTFVSPLPSKRELPSGGKMVPEITVEYDGAEAEEKPLIINDSEKILHWIEDNLGSSLPFSLFPKMQGTDASTVSTRASDGILAGSVLYYNWVFDESYNRSMREKFANSSYVPWFVPAPLSGMLIDYYLGSAREQKRVEAAKSLGLDLDKVTSSGEHEGSIQEMLRTELAYFQSLLDTDNAQPYLLSQKSPTAADFSVYAQIERLVGNGGDVEVMPSIPELKQNNSGNDGNLSRLWQWHDFMRLNHPVKFKGKRKPVDP